MLSGTLRYMDIVSPLLGPLDEIRIHLVDVLLGGGRRMFETLPQRVELRQTGLSEDGGVAHLVYGVVR
jgi:alkaline phosphatase